MPAIRARTMMTTSAIAKSPCAAISEPMPRLNCGAASATGQTEARNGLTQSKSVTSAIRVEMPMTIPGTMTAM